jgi:hypothetical protein
VCVCLPDLADTDPADIVGMISAPRARSADANSNRSFFDIHLGPHPLSPDAAEQDVVIKVFSRRVKQSAEWGEGLASWSGLARIGINP